MYNFGDVVLAQIHFVDTSDIKIRPAFVLFQEEGNIVVAGITSNLKMKGIPFTKKEGAIKESIIKINYIFTISEMMIKKYLLSLNQNKKERVKNKLIKRLN